MLVFHCKYPVGHPNDNFSYLCHKMWKNSCETLISKTYFNWFCVYNLLSKIVAFWDWQIISGFSLIKPVTLTKPGYIRHTNSMIVLCHCVLRKIIINDKEPPGGVSWKSVLKSSAKFTEKHRCQRLFFIKVEGWSLQLY